MESGHRPPSPPEEYNEVELLDRLCALASHQRHAARLAKAIEYLQKQNKKDGIEADRANHNELIIDELKKLQESQQPVIKAAHEKVTNYCLRLAQQ